MSKICATLALTLSLAACGDNAELGPDAGCPPRVDHDCGNPPVAAGNAGWLVTTNPDGSITITADEYAKVVAFRERSIAWMYCRHENDAANGSHGHGAGGAQ